jgi:hypothetical protein
MCIAVLHVYIGVACVPPPPLAVTVGFPWHHACVTADCVVLWCCCSIALPTTTVMVPSLAHALAPRCLLDCE